MRYLVIVLLMLVPLQADAQVKVKAPFYETGTSLLALCTGKAWQKEACSYYITGVHDQAMIRLFGQKNTNTFCFVEKLEPKEMRDLVVGYMKRRKEKLRLPANLVVSAAFQDEYPCKEG